MSIVEDALVHELDVWKYITREYEPPKYILSNSSYGNTIVLQTIVIVVMFVHSLLVPTIITFGINFSFILFVLAVTYANKRKFLKSYNEAIFLLSLQGIDTKYYKDIIKDELIVRESNASVS